MLAPGASVSVAQGLPVEFKGFKVWIIYTGAGMGRGGGGVGKEAHDTGVFL